jgi:predicted DNA-binding transcriptional regulator YafY
MPITKKQYRRFLVIDACLRSEASPFPSREEIIDKIEQALDEKISLSTFEKDLYAMRELPEPGFYAPIGFDRYHHGYFYSDKDYSIANFKLKDEDIDAIEIATAMLCRFSNVPVLNKFPGAIEKIMSVVNARKILNEEDFNRYLQLEEIPPTRGNEYIEPLLHAIRGNNVLRVHYQAYRGEQSGIDYVVHPYLLKEHDNRWYLVGMAEHANQIRTFGLDRIRRTEVLHDKKYKKISFDPGEFFAHTIGISVPGNEKPCTIVLKFSRNQGQYLLSQPLHATQKLIQENHHCLTFKFRLVINYELCSKILGWHRDVEVIRPAKLKSEVIALLESTLNKYE